MDAARQKRLEAIGWRFYDHAGDVFGMTEAEKQEMDFRIDLGRMIRQRREALGLSQQDLAKRLKIGKRKVDELVGGSWDNPLDQILQAYAELGGRIAIKDAGNKQDRNGVVKAKRKPKTAKSSG